MSASKRAIFTTRDILFSSPAPLLLRDGLSRAFFSSVHQPQGGNWVDDIRKGSDEDGTSGESDRRKEKMSLDREKEGTQKTAGSMGDMAKEGAVKSMVETGIELGEKAKQTMDAAWEGVKETTKNVKDAVARDDESYEDDKHDSNQQTDSHVENLRKRAGGYDLRDK